jgi:hypothetical protein
MKQETKKLIEWMKIQLGLLRTNTNEIINNSVDKSITFLDSLPEIELKLCQGGYIQDRNGVPCCNGDKVRFEFEEKCYKECWCTKYSRVETGELRFYPNTKSFCIVFGPDNNGYDWIDFTTSDYGCVWFEKVE